MTGAVTTLAVGHVTHDRLGAHVIPGGCAYYAARTLCALGARSRLVTVVGEDFACEQAWAGCEVQTARAGRTTVFTNVYPQAGPRRQFVRARAGAVAPGLLPAAWRRPDVLFLGPVLGEVDISSWLQQVEARITAVGVQELVRGATGDGHPEYGCAVEPRRWEPDAATLQRIDVAILSEEDLRGQHGLLGRLRREVGLVALTRERAGCDLLQGDRSSWVGIHPAQEVDPTGAGDTFAAGLLWALARGEPVEQAARLGAACASIVLEGRGAQALSRIPEALGRASRIRVQKS